MATRGLPVHVSTHPPSQLKALPVPLLVRIPLSGCVREAIFFPFVCSEVFNSVCRPARLVWLKVSEIILMGNKGRKSNLTELSHLEVLPKNEIYAPKAKITLLLSVNFRNMLSFNYNSIISFGV